MGLPPACITQQQLTRRLQASKGFTHAIILWQLANPFQSLQPLSSFIPLLEWQTQRGGCCWSQPGPGSRAPPPELGKENTDHGLQDGHNREGGKGKRHTGGATTRVHHTAAADKTAASKQRVHTCHNIMAVSQPFSILAAALFFYSFA